MAQKPCILVIDDEVEICNILEDMLTAEGYAVSTATDPEKGLQLAKKLRPEVVLLDLKMPRMDGIEVLRRLRKMDEAIAVVIVTGFGTMDSARTAMRLGAFDYITKPFDLGHVRDLVKDALAHRIGALVEKLKSAKGLLTTEEMAVLDAIGKCRPEGACLWEVAVRAFLLGDTQFMIDWEEESGIPEMDKKNLKRVTQILNEVIRRSKRK